MCNWIVERKSLTKVIVKGVLEEVKHAKPILYLRLGLQKKGKQTPCNNERLIKKKNRIQTDVLED